MEVDARVENVELIRRGNVLVADMMYPRNPGSAIDTVEVGICEVRAADSVRVTYDFERDGWIIEQASTFEWEMDEEFDMDWQEVAFVEAWGRKEDERA